MAVIELSDNTLNTDLHAMDVEQLCGYVDDDPWHLHNIPPSQVTSALIDHAMSINPVCIVGLDDSLLTITHYLALVDHFEGMIVAIPRERIMSHPKLMCYMGGKIFEEVGLEPFHALMQCHVGELSEAELSQCVTNIPEDWFADPRIMGWKLLLN